MAAESTPKAQRYTLTFYVPVKDLQTCLEACFSAGAGIYYHPQTSEPLYTNCAFVSPGTGQFRPSPASDPHIGTAGGEVEYVDDERRVEMVCVGEECMRETVKRLRQAHPYEVVALGVVKLEDV